MASKVPKWPQDLHQMETQVFLNMADSLTGLAHHLGTHLYKEYFFLFFKILDNID